MLSFVQTVMSANHKIFRSTFDTILADFDNFLPPKLSELFTSKCNDQFFEQTIGRWQLILIVLFTSCPNLL